MNIQEKLNELRKHGYKDLWFENDWRMKGVPELFLACKGHNRSSISTNYGEHLYWCDECKIFWQRDSSD